MHMSQLISSCCFGMCIPIWTIQGASPIHLEDSGSEEVLFPAPERPQAEAPTPMSNPTTLGTGLAAKANYGNTSWEPNAK